MASEQMFRGGVYHETETFLEVREVHIQKHGKNLDKNFAAAVNDIKESNKDKGGGDTDNKKQHIGEPHSGRYNESEEAKGVGGYLNKFEIKGVVEAAAKGLRDREEKETTMDHNRCQKAMDDTNANAQERVKQEARNNEEESEAKRVSQNKVFISICKSMPHLDIYLSLLYTYIDSLKALCFFYNHPYQHLYENST